jgi:hypothetical protein
VVVTFCDGMRGKAAQSNVPAVTERAAQTEFQNGNLCNSYKVHRLGSFHHKGGHFPVNVKRIKGFAQLVLFVAYKR